MRKLKVVVRTAVGTLPLVVGAQVTPGCSQSHGKSPEGAGGAGRNANEAEGSQTGKQTNVSAGGGFGAAPATGGAGGMIDFGNAPGGAGSGGAGDFGTGGRMPVTTPGGSCEFIVELPEPGTPAEPGQICAAAMVPVESNRAARVTLSQEPGDPEGRTSRGFIGIDPALQSLVVGTPTVELIDASEARLQTAELTPLSPAEDGAAFSVRWPEPVDALPADGMIRVTFRVNLELRCDGETQLVHSATDIHLCSDYGTSVWVSSGDLCTVCRVIAEMAPSPIVPEPQPSALPLARAVRLRIVELARVSNTVVLLAENDGGDDMAYEWHASAGEVQPLAPDVVAWSLTDGVAAPFIQAAVLGEHGAAVGTFAFNDVVA